jgi:uncharacterized protein
LRCDYCYAGRKFAQRMPWEIAKQAVDFCLARTLENARLRAVEPRVQLGYFGGEPLLEWDLLRQSAEYTAGESQRLGIALKKTVTTNLTLLDEAKHAWLAEQGFYIGLSLDGNAAMHNTLRKFPDGTGSHAKCAQALRFFKGEVGRGEVIVVVDPRNVAHLADSLDWLVAEDIRQISLNPNFYIEWPKPALRLLERGYEKAGDIYLAAYRKLLALKINVIDGKIRAHLKEGYAACDKCSFGDNELAIAASGNIYPCERIVGDDTNTELRIGNVCSGFDADRRAKIIACRGNTNVECRACPVRERCMNWCSCINYATTGAINRVAGIVCRHERLSIRVADRVGAALYAESNPLFLAKFYG